jgi:hypothetical protein
MLLTIRPARASRCGSGGKNIFSKQQSASAWSLSYFKKEENVQTLRIVSSAIVLGFSLVDQSQFAHAGPATHFTLRLNNATIPWLFPPPGGLSSFCSEVPSGVHINADALGSNRVKNATQNNRSGATTWIITDLVKGTASDNLGLHYTFLYENNATFDFDGSTVTVQMKDTFRLKGGDVNYIVGFTWRWAYPAKSLELTEVKDANGETIDIGVAPFVFATSDGINEDPGIVPGSWQQLSTRGDPFHCDVL